MGTVSRTLLGTIIDRAKANFVGNSPEEWESHWLAVGEAFHSELLAEGLTNSAATVRDHLDEQIRTIAYRKERVQQTKSRTQDRSETERRPDDNEEHVLDDDYPVYGDYFYVVDGRVERSDVFGTVRDLRRSVIQQGRTANEVRRCNTSSRGLW